jgi:hypothetical protein
MQERDGVGNGTLLYRQTVALTLQAFRLGSNVIKDYFRKQHADDVGGYNSRSQEKFLQAFS